MNAIQKLKSIPRNTFANVLLRVQNSTWWKESLREETERVTNQRVDFARKQLPARTAENEWCAVAFENLVSSLKNEYSIKNSPESVPAHLLNLGALVSKHLVPLNQIIPVVALTAPVGLALIMRATTSAVTTNGHATMSLSVFRESVESNTKRFTTRMNLGYGVDADLSYLDAVARELAGEIIQDVVDQLKVLAGVPDEVLVESWMNDVEARNKLIQLIETNETRIAVDTRRSSSAAIVTSKAILDILADQGAIDLNPDASLVPGSMDLAGKLKKSGNPVYTTPYVGRGDILIGYRSASNIDTGCIFMPYIPVIGCGTIMDATTFEPRESFVTRNGFAKDADSKKYYRIINASKILS